jgi:aminopeptidase N
MVFILRETALLYYEGVSTESNKKSVAMIIAHELAHMWFGNLVTLQWCDYTWLNEGFACLFQHLAIDEVSSIISFIKLITWHHHIVYNHSHKTESSLNYVSY